MKWRGYKGGDFTEENENVYTQYNSNKKGALNDIYLPLTKNEASFS